MKPSHLRHSPSEPVFRAGRADRHRLGGAVMAKLPRGTSTLIRVLNEFPSPGPEGDALRTQQTEVAHALVSLFMETDFDTRQCITKATKTWKVRNALVAYAQAM